MSKHFLCDFLGISFVVPFQVCAALVVFFVQLYTHPMVVSNETDSILKEIRMNKHKIPCPIANRFFFYFF